MGLKSWFGKLFGRSSDVLVVKTSEEFNREMRRRTDAARQRLREEYEQKMSESDQADRKREEEQVTKLINAIPASMAVAADSGRDSVVVMKICRDTDFTRPADKLVSGPPEPNQLIGPARAVYEFCVETGRQPTIERHEPGITHPYAIVIHW